MLLYEMDHAPGYLVAIQVSAQNSPELRLLVEETLQFHHLGRKATDKEGHEDHREHGADASVHSLYQRPVFAHVCSSVDLRQGPAHRLEVLETNKIIIIIIMRLMLPHTAEYSEECPCVVEAILAVWPEMAHSPGNA